QVRDCLHPRDVAAIVWKQMQSPQRLVERIQNVSGGVLSAISLAQLSDWCAHRFGKHEVASDPLPRPFDLPWIVLDSSKAMQQWNICTWSFGYRMCPTKSWWSMTAARMPRGRFWSH